MSHFSAVDLAPDARRLEAYLDRTARTQGAMKRYIVGAHIVAGSRTVLDVGCGVGHDLLLLADAGIRAIGVEPSAAFADAARERADRAGVEVAIARALGAQLPFRDGAFDGCRIERVLQHVADPGAVVREVCRCVRAGGLLTLFEPDWTTLTIDDDPWQSSAVWLANVRHPTIGTELVALVEQAGAEVADVVEEHSVWRSLERVNVGVDVGAALARCVARGVPQGDADAWIDEQRRRDRLGTFRATITKRLVVAHAP